MKISIPKERRAHERRVAATPETVKKFTALGIDVAIEAGAGEASRITDAAYQAAGATIVTELAELLSDADIVLKVQRPLLAGEGGYNELALMKRGAILIAILSPYADPQALKHYADAGVTAMALEFVPHSVELAPVPLLHSGVPSAQAVPEMESAISPAPARKAPRSVVFVMNMPLFGKTCVCTGGARLGQSYPLRH